MALDTHLSLVRSERAEKHREWCREHACPLLDHVAEHGGLCAFPKAPQPRTVLSGGLALRFVHNKANP